jgi:hypothetical protein
MTFWRKRIKGGFTLIPIDYVMVSGQLLVIVTSQISIWRVTRILGLKVEDRLQLLKNA